MKQKKRTQKKQDLNIVIKQLHKIKVIKQRNMITWSGKRTLLILAGLLYNNLIKCHILIVCNEIIKLRKRVWTTPKWFRVSSFYLWNILLSSNTNTIRKLLPNHTDFLRVYIWQILTFSDNYYEAIYFLLIFSKIYYTTIHIFIKTSP